MEKIFKAIYSVALLAMAAVAVIFYGVPYMIPPELAGVRTVKADANRMIGRHAGYVQTRMDSEEYVDEDGAVSLDRWERSRLPLADQVARAQTLRDAALARAERRIPIVQEPVIYGFQKSWQDKFQASEPLLIIFSQSEIMCSGSRNECWGVDGIHHDGAPDWARRNLTVLQNPDFGGSPDNNGSHYGAVVIRMCVGGWCRPPQLTGFVGAVCPIDNQTSSAMLMTNNRTTVGNIRSKMDFNSRDRFSFRVLTWDHPEAGLLGVKARQACNNNPSAGFVPLTAN